MKIIIYTVVEKDKCLCKMIIDMIAEKENPLNRMLIDMIAEKDKIYGKIFWIFWEKNINFYVKILLA